MQNNPLVPADGSALALTDELTRAADYARDAKSESTRRGYRSDWRDFENWCSARGLAVMPAEVGTVASYPGRHFGNQASSGLAFPTRVPSENFFPPAAIRGPGPNAIQPGQSGNPAVGPPALNGLAAVKAASSGRPVEPSPIARPAVRGDSLYELAKAFGRYLRRARTTRPHKADHRVPPAASGPNFALTTARQLPMPRPPVSARLGREPSHTPEDSRQARRRDHPCCPSFGYDAHSCALLLTNRGGSTGGPPPPRAFRETHAGQLQ
jgi:hypothetical protein